MDVVCGRCRAEYEFDDALISERGTTVRCTNCGLQFKVFPPMGQHAPELWRLFEPGNLERPCAEYASLGRLQKAIARGEVSPKHMLARGSEAPRPLMDIAELEPLLKQPQSEPPPERRMPQSMQPAAPTTNATTEHGKDVRTNPPPMSSVGDDELEAQFENEEVVPASTPPEDPGQYADIVMRAGAAPRNEGDHRPKIRSALSRGVELAPAPPTAEDDAKKPTLVPRTPLRTALQSSQAHGPPPSSDPRPLPHRSAYSSPLDDDRTSETKLVMDPWEAPPPEMDNEGDDEANGRSTEQRADGPKAESADAPPSSVTRSVPPSSGRRRATENGETTKAETATQTTKAVTPLSTGEKTTRSGAEPGESLDAQPWQAPSIPATAKQSVAARAPTPTPLAMRAYTTPGTEPSSASPHLSASRRARGIGVVLAVVLGSVLFLALSNRNDVESQPKAGDTTNPLAVPNEDALRETRAALQQAESVWLKALFEGQALPTDFPGLAEGIERTSPKSWWMVDALRLRGDLSEARRIAAGLDLQRGAYSLALLDLAESPGDPPWPVVQKRLRAAATGEKPPYLARSALIYALLASQNPTIAIAEYDSWSRLPDAQNAPLYETLTSLIDGARRSSSTQAATENGPGSERGEVQDDDDAPQKDVAPNQEAGPRSKATTTAEPEAAGPQPTPQPHRPPEKTAESAPTVSNAIKNKIEQADSLWRTGNRDAALKLYREIVGTIGTSHFLGVRANSRIRQAEREKATHP